MDIVLASNDQKMREMERNIKFFVDKKVDTFKDRLENDKLTLGSQINKQQGVIKDYEKRFNKSQNENKRL